MSVKLSSIFYILFSTSYLILGRHVANQQEDVSMSTTSAQCGRCSSVLCTGEREPAVGPKNSKLVAVKETE